MKDLGERIEELFTDIAFAEERIVENGRDLPTSISDRIDALFTAVSFAEENDSEDARDFICIGRGYGGWMTYCLPDCR